MKITLIIITTILLLNITQLYSEGILFKSGSVEFSKSSFSYLDKIAKKVEDFVSKNPQAVIEINGYTDNTGSENYNIQLSKKRAQSVANYFIEKLNIDAKHFKIDGYGPKNPIAGNLQADGREMNRRVEIILGENKIVASAERKNPVALLDWHKRDVKYKPLVMKDWLKPQRKENFFKLDKVYDSENSFSRIKFLEDDFVLNLGENSLIIIYSGLNEEPANLLDNKFHVELEKGSLLNKLSSLSNKSLNVKTPASDVYLYSVENNIKIDTNNSTMLSVFKGKAEVAAQGAIVEVPEGYGNVTKLGEKPQPPVKLLDSPKNYSQSGIIKIFPNDPVILTWEDTKATKYIVEITEEDSIDILLQTETKTHSIEFKDYEYNKSYHYRIASVNSAGLQGKYGKFIKIIPEEKELVTIDNAEIKLENIITTEKSYQLNGECFADKLIINGSEVSILENKYTSNINLVPGENTINISAIRNGSTCKKQLKVIYKPIEIKPVVSKPIEIKNTIQFYLNTGYLNIFSQKYELAEYGNSIAIGVLLPINNKLRININGYYNSIQIDESKFEVGSRFGVDYEIFKKEKTTIFSQLNLALSTGSIFEDEANVYFGSEPLLGLRYKFNSVTPFLNISYPYNFEKGGYFNIALGILF